MHNTTIMKNDWYTAYKGIRKPMPPQERIERPSKGKNAYKRPRNKKDIYGEED